MKLRNYLLGSLLATSMMGCTNMPLVDFKKLKLRASPNYYLVCPDNYCNVQPNAFSPIYRVNILELEAAWMKLLSLQPRIKLVDTDLKRHKYKYIQYTRFLNFPDFIDIEFISLTEHTSTLAIYSRSRFGYYDFHVNESRVKKWLSLLDELVKKSLKTKSI